MTRAELIQHVRFLFNDTATSNYVQREPMAARPGNTFNGVNKNFFLFNRRVVDVALFAEEDSEPIPSAVFTLTPATGFLLFSTAPAASLVADYHWQKLTDDEISEAIKAAEAAAEVDVTTGVDKSMLDYVSAYVLAFCYLSATSRCAEYYTLSAAGKQISKSELFNHYMSMHQQLLQTAQNLRTDFYTSRGRRQIPSDATEHPDWAKPYLLDGGGG